MAKTYLGLNSESSRSVFSSFILSIMSLEAGNRKSCKRSYTSDLPVRKQQHSLYRGSYMRAPVLLNLLNELGKESKCEAIGQDFS